jgi:FAD/FMN-containing dehydrogenase
MSLAAFRAEIANIPQTDDLAELRRKSRDMTAAFSPIMRAEAREKLAELIVQPRDKSDALRIAAAAARHRIAVLPRGAGTANWGQGIPLGGGIILDMTTMNRVLSVRDRRLRAEPGIIMEQADRITQEDGLEMRMHPSTRRTATLGGYVAGGHVGIGSCTWGILRDIGNVVGVEVVSVEEAPKIVELRGTEVNRVHHAYGTNGIITEIEMPLAPAYRWREAIVDFADFMQASRFAVTLNASDGLVVKMVSINAWPFPSLFRQLSAHIRADRHTVHVMVADEYFEAFEALAADFNGHIAYQGLEGAGDFGRPLYEFSFGHARLHATQVDATYVANIGIFPADDLLGSIERFYARFAPQGPLRMDMKRMDGKLTCQGYPLFHYVSPAHLAGVIDEMQSLGLQAANTHTMHVRENGMKPIDAAEEAFRRLMDPHGLLNPGKFAADHVAKPGEGAALPTSGWKYRKAG